MGHVRLQHPALTSLAVGLTLGVPATAADLRLHVGDVAVGDPLTLELTGAAAGAQVYFAWGHRVGRGPCPQALGGDCLDIETPHLLSRARADASGRADARVPVPSSLMPGDELVLQAAVVGSDGSGVSAPLSRGVEPKSIELALVVTIHADDPSETGCAGELEACRACYAEAPPSATDGELMRACAAAEDRLAACVLARPVPSCSLVGLDPSLGRGDAGYDPLRAARYALCRAGLRAVLTDLADHQVPAVVEVDVGLLTGLLYDDAVEDRYSFSDILTQGHQLALAGDSLHTDAVPGVVSTITGERLGRELRQERRFDLERPLGDALDDRGITALLAPSVPAEPLESSCHDGVVRSEEDPFRALPHRVSLSPDLRYYPTTAPLAADTDPTDTTALPWIAFEEQLRCIEARIAHRHEPSRDIARWSGQPFSWSYGWRLSDLIVAERADDGAATRRVAAYRRMIDALITEHNADPDNLTRLAPPRHRTVDDLEAERPEGPAQ